MEVACNMAPFAAASNNNLNPILEDVDEDIIEDVVQHSSSASPSPIQDNNSAKLVQSSSHHESSDIQNGNTVKYNNNNINNNNSRLISITEDSLTHYDANHRVISQTQVTKVINHKSVKFLDEEEADNMNANLTASQPLMNGGHSRPDSTGLLETAAVNMASTEHDLNSGQQPHVTISSQHLTAREDRAFRTKIDNSYEGWDNPFRPEGELSADAEEILRLWKEGKPLRLDSEVEEDDDATDSDFKATELMKNDKNHNDCEPLLSHNQNGINGKKTEVKSMMASSQPSKAEKVNLEAEPKKKRGCCSLM